MRIAPAALLACFSITFTACSSSSSGLAPQPDASDGSIDSDASVDDANIADTRAEAAAPLACTSRTWCMDYSVKAFRGTPPVAAGGVIAEGTYRLAYTLEPAGIDPDYLTEQAALLYFSQGRFEAPGQTGFGAVGTYSTSTGADGPTLVLQGTTNCQTFGAQGSSASGATRTSPFSATATQLTIIGTVTPLGPEAGAPWKRAYVYFKNDGDVCAPATSDPASADDSFFCRVANCACAQSSGSLITPASCPFIH